MAEAKIMKCTCESAFQDEAYGKGMRVWTPCGKGKDQGSKYRCTVCGATSDGTVSKKKK